ncbi:hypothetical protein C8J57DRAFT_1502429 [Mycena rebaudengoi]|nr:hypothetical protein C8J57DRAFT_1502429 [Mycena rebaudengoi]
MDVETNCSQQTLLFSPLRRPQTLACSLPALALYLSSFLANHPNPAAISVFFYCRVSGLRLCHAKRPSSPKAYSPDAHARSPHTTVIWLEIQADRSSTVSRL